jgi:hypothetical protein
MRGNRMGIARKEISIRRSVAMHILIFYSIFTLVKAAR